MKATEILTREHALILQALNRLSRAPERKRATLMLSFEDKNQFELQQLLEEFSNRARMIGVELTLLDPPEE